MPDRARGLIEREDQREGGAAEAVEGVRVKRLAGVPRGIHRELAVSGEPDGGQAGLDQWALLPEAGGNGKPEEIIQGSFVAGGRGSSFETVEFAVSTSWLAVLCGPGGPRDHQRERPGAGPRAGSGRSPHRAGRASL